MEFVRETGAPFRSGRCGLDHPRTDAISKVAAAPVPGIARFRLARIGLERPLRRLAYWIIHSGLATTVAAGLCVLDRRRGLRLRGWLAAKRYRHDDHTDFWDNAARYFPSDPVFVRNTADAALRVGRTADAEAALAWLIENRNSNAADWRLVVGLTNSDVRRDDFARIRVRVRRFLGSLRGRMDYRIAALRLNRTVFAHFSRAAGATVSSRIRLRFLNMLAHTSMPAQPKGLLVRVATCEAELERAFPESLFDTDVSATQRRAFVSLVHECLAAQRRFSFVRIGDGEAACLPYEPRLAVHALADARDRERIWWGRPLPDAVRARLAPRIAQAMWDADCIGIPTIPRFLREVRLEEPDALETSLTGRGLRSILYCVERTTELRSSELPAPIFTSCHLHQDLALWNCYEELLDGVSEVVLVSCHPGLADIVAQRFGTRIAGNVVLPPDNVSGPLVGRPGAKGDDLPRILDSAIEQMGELPRGRLVLVGAGYPGKVLLSVARERGGVALDLGSVFDYWLDLNTRSYLDMPPA